MIPSDYIFGKNALPIWEQAVTFAPPTMRIIASSTIKKFIAEYPEAAGHLRAWTEEGALADWNNPNELKAQFGKASLLGAKRVIFNIHGNAFRLIVDVEYRFKMVFVIWFGTHKEYDKINANEVKFVKTD